MILKRIQHSLSARLLILFIFSGAVLLLLVGSIMGKGFSRHFRYSIQPFMVHYIELMEQELGTPPSLEQAKRITREIPVDIHVYGPDQNWSTGGTRLDPQELDAISEKYHRTRQRFRVKRIDDELILQTRSGDYDIYFQLHHLREVGHGGPYGSILLLAIFGVLLGIYYATRYLFKPIEDIDQGVKQFGEGNLEHRITKRRNDQLGDLTDSVNDMAEDISNMLEAKRQLLLGISHELRSPLTRSRVNLALLDQSTASREITSDIELMDELITELLESERLNSRHASLQPERVRVDQLIEEVLDTDFEDHIISAELEAVEAEVDPPRMKLLIRNLLQNAVKHNGEGAASPIISLNTRDKEFRLIVTDFGTGIEAKHIPFLTEPFYRADPSRQRKTGGYGLGLYLCRMIVQAHGGQINIQSEVNKGTKIICQFPLSGKIVSD